MENLINRISNEIMALVVKLFGLHPICNNIIVDVEPKDYNVFSCRVIDDNLGIEIVSLEFQAGTDYAKVEWSSLYEKYKEKFNEKGLMVYARNLIY